jgi:ABC-type nitrate/sulfonate/bicarbonate transport system substrate-binding protein
MSLLRIGAAAIILALAAMMPAKAEEMEKTSLALPAVAFIFSTAYIAEDAGIFKAEGLEVTQQVITGIGAANAVIAGSIDFSFSSGVTLTRAAARNVPVIGIADTYDHTGFWILLRKNIADERHFDPNAPLAERAKLLKGLRFGVGGINTIPHAYLKLIAKLGGLDGEKDIVVAGITPPEQIGALVSNSIDGISSGPPVIEQAVHDGIGIIIANGTTGKIDPPSLAHIAANGLMTRRQLCIDQRSLCVKMGSAMVKANAFMHEHPDEAMALLGKRLNVKDPSVLAEAYRNTLESTPSPPLLDAQALATADDLNVAAGFMKAEENCPPMMPSSPTNSCADRSLSS